MPFGSRFMANRCTCPPMFGFEKLIVYQKSREFNSKVHSFLLNTKLDRNTHDQLKRAACSIMLKIA
jgi:hypothetical protein